MKLVVATISAFTLVSATAASAGTLVFEAEEEQEIIVEEEPMGSSNAAWIVPLLAIGVIGLAVASGGDDDDDDGNGNGNGLEPNGSGQNGQTNGQGNGAVVPQPIEEAPA